MEEYKDVDGNGLSDKYFHEIYQDFMYDTFAIITPENSKQSFGSNNFFVVVSDGESGNSTFFGEITNRY